MNTMKPGYVQSHHPGPPYRVLVVDDEAGHRLLEKEILGAPQYRVTEAASGFEAIALMREHTFDVVVLDIFMPEMDGNQVCREIRNNLGDLMTPIIIVTGFGGHNDLSVSLRAGATDFIRKPYHPSELEARVDAAAAHKRLTDQLDSAESMLFALARMVEAKDSCTGDHCSRLAHNAQILGHALQLGHDELMALRRAGVLHDIGKLAIPDSILLKPAALDETEWSVMRQHPEVGARLCESLKSMRLTVPIIRSHHERWDGSGYPHGLKGEAIPLLARVFQIVDIYDALAYARPYKPALPLPEIIAILEQETARGWRDSAIMTVFLDILRNRPHVLEHTESTDDLGAALHRQLAAAYQHPDHH